MRFRATALIVLGTSMASGLVANWPQWRGPQSNGRAPEAHDLSVSFSPTENVLWRVKLPNWSAATPIIWGDVIFALSSEPGFVRLQGQGGRAKRSGNGPDRIF